MAVVTAFQTNVHHPLLKAFGQPGAVIMVAVRHRGPALLGTTVMLVRIRQEGSGAVSFRPGHVRVPANALLSRPERHTHVPLLCGQGLASRILPRGVRVPVSCSSAAGEQVEG